MIYSLTTNLHNHDMINERLYSILKIDINYLLVRFEDMASSLATVTNSGKCDIGTHTSVTTPFKKTESKPNILGKVTFIQVFKYIENG